ncbi:MAG: hypothetical protein KAG62_10370 [Caulobacter sp.]|nr:hypothetical protein [Caulobacter sp.]
MPKLPIRPTEVRAKFVMGEDEPCWCTSGRRWADCHKDREKEKPENFYQGMAKLRREYERGYCSHPQAPDACATTKIIRAHTLQRNGTLNRIAKDGHVYSAKTMAHGLATTNGEFVPQREGLKSASTFLGFCGKHDTEMFKPIETGLLPIDAKSAFLLSFRAAAYELFEKRAGLRGLKNLKPDAGKGIMEQERLVNALLPQIVALELPVADFTAWKEKLDAAFLAGDYSAFSMFAVEFEGVLPVASTCAVQPGFGIGGVPVQDLSEEHLAKIAYSITMRGDHSVFVLCWSKDEPAAQKFADLFMAVPPEHMATAAMLVALFFSENTFFSPEWWEGLTKDERAWIIEVLAVGIPSRMRLTMKEALSPDTARVRLEFAVRNILQT